MEFNLKIHIMNFDEKLESHYFLWCLTELYYVDRGVLANIARPLYPTDKVYVVDRGVGCFLNTQVRFKNVYVLAASSEETTSLSSSVTTSAFIHMTQGILVWILEI